MDLVFGIYRGDKKVKTLKAKTMETVLKNFTKYAKEKGFLQCIYSVHSFGNTAWQNKNGEVLLLTSEN